MVQSKKRKQEQSRIDYNEIFAPVVRLDTVWALISLAAQKG